MAQALRAIFFLVLFVALAMLAVLCTPEPSGVDERQPANCSNPGTGGCE